MKTKMMTKSPKNDFKIESTSSRSRLISSFKNQDSRIIKIKIQDSRFKNQEEDSVKISIKKFFKTLSSTRSFHKILYQRVLLSGNRLPEGSNRLPVASIVFQTNLQSCNRLP